MGSRGMGEPAPVLAAFRGPWLAVEVVEVEVVEVEVVEVEVVEVEVVEVEQGVAAAPGPQTHRPT
jgi:hypothetical protein